MEALRRVEALGILWSRGYKVAPPGMELRDLYAAVSAALTYAYCAFMRAEINPADWPRPIA
ncbi:MAG: hypothetical protein ABWK05_09955 [Pyrobaculum sp.]